MMIYTYTILVKSSHWNFSLKSQLKGATLKAYFLKNRDLLNLVPVIFIVEIQMKVDPGEPRPT